jgi:hypothetical protein
VNMTKRITGAQLECLLSACGNKYQIQNHIIP